MAKSKPHGLASIKPKRYVTGGEITAIYQDLFGRAPDKEGLDYWVQQLKGKTAAEAYDKIGKSATGADAKEVSAKEIAEKSVKAAYREQLGREADAGGLEDYIKKLESGKSIADVNQSLNRSLEGQQYDTQILTSGYRQMFERNPEQEGFQYWFSRMQSDPNLAQTAINDYLKGGAQNTDIAKAAKAMAEGYYTNFVSPDLEADPYGGRGLTQSIYDVPKDAANISYINGVPVQFAAPVTQGTVRSEFTTGTPEAPGYTSTAGENILQSGAVAAAARRALDSGAMSADEFRTLQTDLRAAGNDVNKIFTALNTPKAHVVLDQLYGFQLGAGNTLEEAQTRAKEIQGVLDSLGTNYAPSNFVVADQAKAMGVPYAFGKDAFTGYNTQATTADIINAKNAEVKAREAINALEGAMVRTQRPQYGEVTFAQQAPTGIGALKPFQTYADRALLSGDAPGAPAALFGIPTQVNQMYQDVLNRPADPEGMAFWSDYVGRSISPQEMAAFRAAAAPELAKGKYGPDRPYTGGVAYVPPAAPASFPGVPAAEARPAVNVSPEYQGAQDVAAAISAARGVGMAEGGIASLARQVQDKGRGNDTMLVHMTPNEVAGLQALAMQMGGSGTINPQTGLPEFGWLDRTFKRIIKPVAKIAQFVLPFTGIGAIPAALLSGLAGGFAGGKGGKTFDFKRALVSGITSYGVGSLARNLSAAGDAASTAAAEGVVSGPSTQVADKVSDLVGTGVSQAPGTSNLLQTAAQPGPASFVSELPAGSNLMDYVKTTGQNIKSTFEGIPKYFGGDAALKAEAAKAGLENPITGKILTPATAGTLAVAGTTTGMAMDEADALKAEQDAIIAAKEEEDERLKQEAYRIMSTYPFQYAEGGPVTDELGYDMAAGGLKEGSFVVPADVVAHLGNGSSDAGLKMLAKKYGASPIKGPGDGMSDSIPTTIGGKQPARVADGEAVIPAEVVKKVGPNKLYKMMDKVRQARTGTTKQGKEINPMRYMPA
jgi:hypothetical protein